MKVVRWGIIGCGDVTEKKSGPGFQKAVGSELVAVMRRNGTLAADYARRHGVPRWYDDADRLMNDPEVDAIYIATPPSSHRDYTLRAAAAGKPVYVEKPMSLGPEQSTEMIEACRSAGVPLFVAYYRRAMPKYLRVVDLIQNGTIGNVRCVELAMFQSLRERDRDPAQRAWRVDPAVSGGGLLLDVGSHALDLLDLLLGPIEPSSVVGRATNLGDAYDAEDTVTGIWRHASGPHGRVVYGTGLWCFCADRDEDSVTVIGDTGRLRFSVLDVAAPIIVEASSGTGGTAGRTVVEVPPPEHVQQPLIQTAVNELRGAGVCPSTGESALRTDLVMARLRASERVADTRSN